MVQFARYNMYRFNKYYSWDMQSVDRSQSRRKPKKCSVLHSCIWFFFSVSRFELFRHSLLLIYFDKIWNSKKALDQFKSEIWEEKKFSQFVELLISRATENIFKKTIEIYTKVSSRSALQILRSSNTFDQFQFELPTIRCTMATFEILKQYLCYVGVLEFKIPYAHIFRIVVIVVMGIGLLINTLSAMIPLFLEGNDASLQNRIQFCSCIG